MLLAVFLVGFALFADAAPMSKGNKGPQLVYDQKQHGDYNVQVHLKDFQIIALLGEESLGGLGDYDYNYDYSDFTVKPVGSSSTAEASEDISTTTSKISNNDITSTKPSEDLTTLKPTKEEEGIKLSTTGKPLGLLAEIKPEGQKPSSDTSTNSTDKKGALPSSTEKIGETTKKDSEIASADSIPGQIQVQVIQSPEGYPNLAVRKEATENKDSSGKSNGKKCLTGFSRDNKGRCRRVRRPQSALPFNFGRLAHLASRFRSNDGIPNNDLLKTHSLPLIHQN